MNYSFKEVEAVLAGHEAVKHSVVFTIPHARLEELLIAAVQFHTGKHAAESQLKIFAMQQIPMEKIPSQIVLVDLLPRDRDTLPETLSAMIKPGYVPPGTATESRLIPLWLEVLECETIGRFDNFFVCGGDMVLAELLASRISEELHTHIAVQDLFLYPSVGEMGCFIDEKATKPVGHEFSHLMTEIDELSDDDLLKFLDD